MAGLECMPGYLFAALCRELAAGTSRLRVQEAAEPVVTASTGAAVFGRPTMRLRSLLSALGPTQARMLAHQGLTPICDRRVRNLPAAPGGQSGSRARVPDPAQATTSRRRWRISPRRPRCPVAQGIKLRLCCLAAARKQHDRG